jgi:hypothetical protein
VTGRTLQIEGKGLDQTTIPNLLHLIVLGNDAWLIRASGDERRYFSLECGPAKRRDTVYFGAIQKQLDDGGYAAFLYHLLHEVDLKNFDVRNPPHTKELTEQMADSESGASGLWLECLQLGVLPGLIQQDGTVQLLPERLLEWASKHQALKHMCRGLKAAHLHKLLGKGGMKFFSLQTRIPGITERPRHWAIPKLADCRALWEKQKYPVDWPEDVENWADAEPYSLTGSR